MKITMYTIGSTGDVRPYIMLGRELQRRGHEVTIAALSMFEEMISGAGLRYAGLAGDAMQVMSNIMKPGVSGAQYLVQVEKSIRSIAPALLRDLLKAAQGADAIVCNFFCNMYYSVAEYYRIPCVQTHFFPMDPRPDMPISSAPGQNHGPAWNLMSYKLGYLLISILEKRYLTRWRREHGMEQRKIHTGPDYHLLGHTIPAVYAVSPHLMPPAPCWPENIHMSGFWWDDQAVDYTPDGELADFLLADEKPVYIGFGSMVSGDMQKTFEIVLEAVERSGVRAVISHGWAEGMAKHDQTSRMMTIDDVPHDWLFPRVGAVVHHGGCGTTASGLRYGKPTLVIPFGGDQPFWGQRVYEVGCGPRPIDRQQLTAENLAYALRDLTINDSYRAKAEEMAVHLNKEKGTQAAADLIEHEIAAWK